MIHPHQLHSLGKLYHEDALRAARRRDLVEQANSNRRQRSSRLGRVGFALSGALLGLKG
jgi:hypothetical protein